jgi:hypothetical protein
MNCNLFVAQDTVTLRVGATEQTTFSPRRHKAKYPKSGRYVHEYTVLVLVGERRSRYIEPYGCDIFHPRKTINNNLKSDRCFVDLCNFLYRVICVMLTARNF